MDDKEPVLPGWWQGGQKETIWRRGWKAKVDGLPCRSPAYRRFLSQEAWEAGWDAADEVMSIRCSTPGCRNRAIDGQTQCRGCRNHFRDLMDETGD